MKLEEYPPPKVGGKWRRNPPHNYIVEITAIKENSYLFGFPGTPHCFEVAEENIFKFFSRVD